MKKFLILLISGAMTSAVVTFPAPVEANSACKLLDIHPGTDSGDILCDHGSYYNIYWLNEDGTRTACTYVKDSSTAACNFS